MSVKQTIKSFRKNRPAEEELLLVWAGGQVERPTDVTKLIADFPTLQTLLKYAYVDSLDRDRLIKHGLA
jgi:hypothetical protein